MWKQKKEKKTASGALAAAYADTQYGVLHSPQQPTCEKPTKRKRRLLTELCGWCTC
jgi:hypothetical protein